MSDAFSQLMTDRLCMSGGMDGLFDYVKYREYVADVIPDRSLVADIDMAKSWAAQCDSTKEVDEKSSESLFLLDGIDAAIAGIVGFVENGFDARLPEYWLLLKDAVVGWSRVVTHPHTVCRAGLTVQDIALGLAMSIDIAARAADRDVSHTANANYGDMHKRAARIYIDLVCGRGAAWIWYADMLGRQAAYETGKDWLSMRDTYSMRRMTSFCQTLIDGRIDSIADMKAAGSRFGTLSVAAAIDYENWQRKCFYAATGHLELGHWSPKPEVMAEFMHEDVWWRIADCVEPPARPGSDMTCYNRAFQVGPIAMVVSLPVDMEEMSRKGYIAEHTSRLQALRDGREDPEMIKMLLASV